jgi:PhnB protein
MIMPAFQSYLIFNGNCEEAFNFYKSVFGGEFSFMGRFGDMPQEAGGGDVPEEQKNRVMHVGLEISEGTTLLGSDTGGPWESNYTQGNSYSISIAADSKEQADAYFNGLSEGGKVDMPMADTFWGDYFGSLTDKFGVNWMIGYNEQAAAQ